MAATVLSLQDSCLLYLITHVEEYSPQTLALLPKHLRQALLSSVAPIHLYQLDQTKVADGIDTDRFWMNMNFSNLDLPPHRYPKIDSRESFASVVGSSVFYLTSPVDKIKTKTVVAMSIEIALFGLHHIHLSTEMIQYLKNDKKYVNVENKHCFITTDTLTKYRSHHCQKHLPSTLSYSDTIKHMEVNICSCDSATLLQTRLRTLHSDIAKQVVSVLVRADACPSKLVIDARRVAMNASGEGGTMEPFLVSSNLTRVAFINSKYGNPKAASSVLTTIFSTPQPSLKHLTFDSVVVDDFFAPVLASYNGLKKLKLVIGEYVCSFQHAILNQKKLECLQLSGDKIDYEIPGYKSRESKIVQKYCHTVLHSECLFEALSGLFLNNDFHNLTLDGFSLPQGGVKMLVAAFFMSTPSNEKCSLVLSNCILQPERMESFLCDPSVNISREHAEKYGPRKHLSLTGWYVLPETFWKWFASIPYIHLASLSGTCNCNWSEHHMRVHFKDHPNFSIYAT